MIPKIPVWLLPVILIRKLAGSSFLKQVVSAYGVQFVRVLNWIVAAGLVYRWEGEVAFAAFSLARAMVTILNYAAIGVAPALVVLYPKYRSSEVVEELPAEPRSGQVLEYAHSNTLDRPPPHVLLYRTALSLSVLPAIVLLLIVVAAGEYGTSASRFWTAFAAFAFAFGVGACARLIGDVGGARLQAEHRIGFDNSIQLLFELAWMPLSLGLTYLNAEGLSFSSLGDLFGKSLRNALILSTGAATVFRCLAAQKGDQIFTRNVWDSRFAKLLLLTGGAMLLGQLADFLYGPLNQLIIKQFLSVRDLANYAPALHIDGALLLLVSGLSMVLFPKTATAYHSRNFNDLRIYFVLGTIFGVFVLSIGAVVVCWVDGWLFQKWFGDPLPATQAILPLVMIHTVIGGSASIGRSVLFGMGRMKPYAIASIVGGVTNAILAILVVTLTDWGLQGIIYVTILTVSIRCAIWLPWYTLRAIYQEGGPFRIRWN